MRNLLVSVWKSKGSNDTEEKSICLWRRYVLGNAGISCLSIPIFALSGYTLRSVIVSDLLILYNLLYGVHPISQNQVLLHFYLWVATRTWTHCVGIPFAQERTPNVTQHLQNPVFRESFDFPETITLKFRFLILTRWQRISQKPCI